MSKQKNIVAFGKRVSREKAIEIIIDDYIGAICHAHMTHYLEAILLSGFTGLDDWTNEELEDFISELLIENQPQGKI